MAEWKCAPYLRQYQCSECLFGIGMWLDTWDADYDDLVDGGENMRAFKYCPNCGAKMDEEATND